MGLTVSEGVKRQPAPSGTHLAVCFGVIDLGTQPGFNPGDSPRRKLWLWWELSEEADAEGKRVTVGGFYGASIGKKANLRKLLEGWRGRPFTDEELKAFQMRNVLGKPCQVTVIHEKKNGETRDNISAVSGLPKGMPAPAASRPVLALDLDPDKFDRAVYDALPNFLKDTIGKSPEGRALGLGTGNGQPTGGKQWPTQPPDDWDENGKPIHRTNGVTTYGDANPDIPF